MRLHLAALSICVTFVVSASAPVGAVESDGTSFLDSVGNPLDEFGAAVAITDSRLVVGAPAKDGGYGAVFVYEQTVPGTWSGRRLTASDGLPGDRFGDAVGVAGDRVVVGARFADGADTGTGAVYVFERAVDGSWIEHKIIASDGQTDDGFGGSVAVDGDRIVVGADWDDDQGGESGSAYVFTLVDGVWTEQKLVASDGATGDLFGRSVAVAGDRVAVGAIYDDGILADVGAVYVYDLAEATERKLTPEDEERVSLFGHAVAMSGDLLAVGAPLADLVEDGDLIIDSGAVFRYDLSTDDAGGVAYRPAVPSAEAQFGFSVATDGARVVVGAPNDGAVAPNAGAVAPNAGAVYAFEDGVETKFSAPEPAGGDVLGRAVGVAGDHVVAGAPRADVGAQDAGAAFLLDGADVVLTDFEDTQGHTFEVEIGWLVAQGITTGCDADGNRYCPDEPVSREQMATFLRRALALDPATDHGFTDVSGLHAASVGAIADAGITAGCDADTRSFCPTHAVTRAQMATFLVRALDLVPEPGDRFDDVAGVHAANIETVAVAGITVGCAPGGRLYCPDEPVTRGQMAAFLARAFGS